MNAKQAEIASGTEAPAAKRDVAKLQDSLRKYCLSLAESAWEAEDLTQDAWLKALNGRRFNEHPNPEAYLLKIAKNAWIDRTRRSAKLARMRRTERPEEVRNEAGTLEIEDVFRAMLKHLSPVQRAVFLLRDVFGYSSAETAALLRMTEGAAKAVLHRARRKLPLVREAVENDASPAADDPLGLKAYLQAIAAAYDSGNVAALLELVQRYESEPVPAIGMLHTRRLQASVSRRAIPMLGNAPLLSLAS